jgi:2,4-dienoyl-CoA reductase-like NADH-dependent reductase (Old Yellow Enzyme family)
MKLFEPYDINGMVLPNRIVLPAMVTRLSGEDGHVNQDIEDRYVRYAQGEPGLIVVEAMAVHTSKSGPLLRLGSDEFIGGHTEMLKKMRDVSPSKVVPQIIHFLKIARSGWRQTINDLSIEDIKQIIDDYGTAAVRAREAGYDGVELHMAHAYTLSSFLSARNARKDEYGGSLENRLRMPTEVILKVRERVGDDFPMGLRFDAEECIIRGYGLEESKEMALRFAQLGMDYISVSAGGKFEDAIPEEGKPLYPYTGYSGERCMPGMSYPDGANIYLPAGIKKYLNERGYTVPVVGTGKIRFRSTSANSSTRTSRRSAVTCGTRRAFMPR